MNIVTPIPTAVLFPTANIPTEAARRENVQRETIPQTGGNENSAAESGVGSESDRVKTPGQQPQLTYERPQSQQNAQNTPDQGDLLNQDNAEDPSAGKENAESEQQRQQQELAEKKEIEELKSRDQEVRSHEQAHAAVGGQYAGSPSYEFESGPDGKQYAVGGEVPIDISEEKTPEETIRKMQQVRAAALAPADPSPQDLRVASEATKLATEARSDVAREKIEQVKEAIADNIDQQLGARSIQQSTGQEQSNDPTIKARNDVIGEVPSLDEIVDGFNAEPPIRTLDNSDALDIDAQESAQQFATLRENRDSGIQRRISVIENFYQNISAPRSQGIQQSA
ncbi:putative metalloprotease CJM1_0395 family protein [Aliiglaciecola litoralis]|uniref:SprA-related family protein n=1 Tax=Aliiglaciecola litoralis TaxID=582857 RepID=A0ABP3WPV5_9ALTE